MSGIMLRNNDFGGDLIVKLLLYKKDVLNGLSETSTASVDFIITSPPYWATVDYGYEGQLGQGLTYPHFLLNLEKVWLECMRVLKADSFITIIAADIRKRAGERPKLYSFHCDIINFFQKMDLPLSQHYIWLKPAVNHKKGKLIYGSVGTKKHKSLVCPPYIYSELSIEHILVFRKSGKRLLPSLDSRLIDPQNALSTSEVREWVKPVWNIISPFCPHHPATLAPEVARRLIRMYSLSGDWILDPFAGSGTSLIEAIKYSRNAIGYEMKGDYINLILSKVPPEGGHELLLFP